MRDMLVCPNCGKLINVDSSRTAVTCNHCQEDLLVSSGSKLVLANPIHTYLTPDTSTGKGEHQRSHFSAAERPPLSAERRKKTARLAYERMIRQEQMDHSGLAYGILAILFGGLLGILAWLRSEYIKSDWVGWIGLWIGVFVLAVGMFVTTWFYRSIKSGKASKREIEEEIKS